MPLERPCSELLAGAVSARGRGVKRAMALATVGLASAFVPFLCASLGCGKLRRNV